MRDPSSTARVYLTVAVLLASGCDIEEIDICNRMIECQGDPCSVSQCTENLSGFSEAELNDTQSCFETSSCSEILGGACEGEAAAKALRCCAGTPATGCDDPMCQEVADDEPWPVQCLGETPSTVLCAWARECDLWNTDSEPPPTQSQCETAAAAYDDPARAAEASECRSCILSTSCEDSATCTTCDTSLIP